MVNPKVGKAVKECNLGQSHNLGGVVETISDCEKTKIRDQDSQTLGRQVDGRHGRVVAEVRGSARVLGKCQTLVAGGCVEEHVCLPADQLVSNEEEQADDRGILSHVEDMLDLLLDLGHDLVVVLLSRNECSVLLHVVGVSVMSGMAVLLYGS